MMHRTRHFLAACTFACLACGTVAFTGCERKEKILDIETPRGDVEVERSLDTGKVDVEINGNE